MGRKLAKIKSLSLTLDKNNNKYRFKIKTGNPSKWIDYSRWLYKKYYGHINPLYVIHHIDGNPLNNCLNNLTLISRKEHIKIHKNDLFRGKYAKR